MSLKRIKTVIENFVTLDNNDALVINGRYGVGKTYYWKELIQRVSEDSKPYFQGLTKGEGRERKIGKPHYAYVSLFGIGNLESLKNAIFTEIVSSKDVGSFSNRSSSLSKGFLSKIENIPQIQKFTGGLISSVAFHEVKNALICLDDVDRKSDKLSITEIIGLANLLKEHHNCKIVLILNENKLINESEDYRIQIEKLIDFEIHFSPETDEILDYVFPNSFFYGDFIKSLCLILEIKNIRIIQKIRRYIEELTIYLTGLMDVVIKDILRSVTLFVFCHYNRDGSTPSLEVIENFGNYILDKPKLNLYNYS